MEPREVLAAEQIKEAQAKANYEQQSQLPLSEIVKNSANNAWVQLQKNIPQLNLLGADVGEAVLGGELVRKLYEWEGRDFDQVRINAYKELEDLDNELKATGGSVSDNIKYLNGTGLVGNLVDGIFNVGSTALPALATAGGATLTGITGQAVADYNLAKAKSKGISIEELYRRGEAELGVPATIGAVATGLELVGLKGTQKALLGQLKGSTAKKLALFGFETNKEGMTEWIQTGLDAANTSLAEGKSVEDASKKAVSEMLSKRGLDSYLMGTLGSVGAAGVGRVVSQVVKPSAQSEVQEKVVELEAIDADIKNPNLSPQAKEVLATQASQKIGEISTIVEKDINDTDAISNEDKQKSDVLNNEKIALSEIFTSPDVSDVSRSNAEARIAEIDKELNAIKPQEQVTFKYANIDEVPDSLSDQVIEEDGKITVTLPKSEADALQKRIDEGLEPDMVRMEGRTEPLATQTIEQAQEVVTEPNLTVNEETVSAQEIPVVEETAQDLELPNEVLNKAEIDLEALKQVNNKNAKYDASIKRLTNAKNNGLITDNEFNEQKKRFDDVLRESLPKISNLAIDEATELNSALEEEGLTIDDIIEYESTEQQARLNQEVVQQPEPNITADNREVDTDKGKQAEKTEEVKKGGTDAVQINQADEVLQRQQGEVGETGGGRRGVEQGEQGNEATKETKPEQVQSGTQEKVSGITQTATAKAREQMGIEAYEKVSQTNEQRRAKAEQAIKDGYNVKQLIADIKSNEDYVPSRQEMEILKIYESSLDAAINKNPTSELLAERTNLLRTVDIGTSRAGAALQAVAGLEASVDNLSNFLTQEAISHGVDRLPQSVIDKLRTEYEKGQDAKKAYEEGYEKAKQELVKAQAENELSKTRANRPSVKKSKADYVSERDELKKSIKDKLKKARGQLNAVPVPYLNELIAIAPDVAKLVKSYVEEGISKLDDIVKRVHKDLEEEIDGITEQDVLDLISGQYNQKRPTKNDILSQVRDLREEAKLLKKIDDLESGKMPSDPIKQIRKNADLEKLRKQIKDLEDEVGVTEARTIKSRRTALENKIKKLQEDLELGNFDLEPTQPRKVRLDAETQKKQDEYIAFLKETNRRRDQAMYEQQSKITKAWLKFQQVLGLRRLIQTSIDFSMPFRQAVTVTLNPRYVPTTLKSFANMFKSTFSEKKYDRIMFDIQQDPLYQDMRIDGLMFSEVDSKDNLKREEDFRTSFIYQIPYLREPFLASNRAAAGYINTARYNLYIKGVERLRAQGITHENSPENYEALAKWVMNMTGRGNLLSFMEKGENASKWQRIMGDTFYGTRLMASRFNMLNPNYYIQMPKEQRVEALKDISSYVGLSAAVAFAAIAAGATVSTDPEDADFLKAKWGNKRYDLFTGGMNTYLRTAYRLMKAIYQRTNPSLYGESPDAKKLKEANKYGAFAIKSGTDFFRYKLAPNTSYVLSATMGKDPLGRPFNPNDIVAFYPMYVDDLRGASKKDNAFMESMSILAPSLFGIGVQEYDNKK